MGQIQSNSFAGAGRHRKEYEGRGGYLQANPGPAKYEVPDGAPEVCRVLCYDGKVQDWQGNILSR